MKKIIFILVAVLATTFTSYAQITTMSAVEKKVEKVAVEYDVTKNFLGTKNVESYVGQVLYVKTKPLSLLFRKTNPKNPYESKDYDGELLGKYFKVIKVEYGCGFNTHIFTLQNRDNAKDIVYDHYNSLDTSSENYDFPFIVVSHFEWCKSNLIGKTYLLTYFTKGEKTCAYWASETDFMTGEIVTHNTNDIWECINITIENKRNKLVALLKNKNGNVITYELKHLEKDNEKVYILTENAYHNLVSKNGVTMVNAMRNHCIKIGMSKELLIMSWGKPEKINYNSYGADQWVYYGGSCIYVNNGKVEGWN